MNLGALFAQAQRPRITEADLLRAGDDFGKLKQLGNECFKVGDYALAARAYHKASKHSKNDTDSGTLASNHSFTLLKLGELEEALTQAEVAIKFRPEWDKGYYRKISALIALERPEEAEKVLDDNANIFPSSLRESREDLVALEEQIKVAKLPWQELEPNVQLKVISGERSAKESYLEDLDVVWVHYRVINGKTKELLNSTRTEFIGGENPNAAPRNITLAEYECPDILDAVLRRFEDGGEGIVRTTGPCSYYPEEGGGEQLQHLEFQFQVYKHEKAVTQATGTKDVAADSSAGSGFLNGAVSSKEKLDTFDRSKAAADQQEAEALEVAWSVKKGGMLAARRFRRALEFCKQLSSSNSSPSKSGGAGGGSSSSSKETSSTGVSAQSDGDQQPVGTTGTTSTEISSKHLRELEVKAKLGLARSLVIAQHVFAVEKADRGDFGKDLVKFLASKGHKSAVEQSVSTDEVEEALNLADDVLATAPGGPTCEHYLVKAEALNALDRLEDSLAAIEEGFKLDPKNEPLRSERARVNLKLKKTGAANSAEQVKAWKERVDTEIAKTDDSERNLKWIRQMMLDLGDMCDKSAVQWDQLMTIKIGKPIGQIQKASWAQASEVEGEDSLNQLATKLIKKFRNMAENNRPLWS
ncbi:unnamed protein product [Amoebophrya sp. A120]|nr:unnamed protein product [Amoebophrya sp. A120]|eukprot:GSA120T00001454001.1